MKPYIAVLYDSFLESVSSRVLWMLLGAWTLLLAALFPLTLTSTESYRISRRSMSSDNSAKMIMDSLADASAGRGSPSVQAVYERLGEDFQGLLQQRKENQRKISIGTLIEELNRLLELEDLYDEKAWPTAAKRSAIKTLVEQEHRTPQETERLNRQLLNLAFPNRLNFTDGQATVATWGGLRVGTPLQLPIETVRPIVERIAFPLVMRVGLGIAAMLIAIVITSPMIPDMFQTGSLHLLLSKPLSRSLLFLTKFLGGCIFVAINIIYLLIGLYIYAGTRLQIWNDGILWCIPLFIFMFIVYYSVSALVGLIWKNPIVCVVVTAVFWAVCFGVGTLHFFFNIAINVQPQATKIVPIHDAVVIGNAQGRILFWDPERSVWQTAYGHFDGMQLVGPVWVESARNLYFARKLDDPLGFAPMVGTKGEFARLPDLVDPNDTTFRSKPWGDGRLDSGPELPSNTVQFIPWKDSFALFNQDTLFAFDVSKIREEEKKFPALSAMFDTLWKREEQQASQAFVPILQEMNLAKPFDVSVSPTFKTIAAVSSGELRVWRETEETGYQLSGTLPIEIAAGQVCLIACNDQTAIVCPNGADPVVIDLENFRIAIPSVKARHSPIRQIQTSSEGGFALLDQKGNIWVTDKTGEELVRPALPGQGMGVAIAYSAAGELWVAHRVNQADRWDLKSKRSTMSIRPTLTNMERVYHYLINPFYLANPKPASVNQTIDHMLTRRSNRAIALDRQDLERAQDKLDPWQPIWSNAAFIVVMLSICCWYLYRQDL